MAYLTFEMVFEEKELLCNRQFQFVYASFFP